jgi:hypothetical protein
MFAAKVIMKMSDFFFMSPAHIHWFKMVFSTNVLVQYTDTPQVVVRLCNREDLQFSHFADFLGVSTEAN